jgi:amino acid adenylation domain-containing protein
MRYLLQDVFLSSVLKFPNRIAVSSESGEKYTYAELNSLSNRFANYFRDHTSNVREKPFVAILSSVNPNSIAAVLGALKIGCAYIPLDEYSPTDRLEKILEHTKVDTLVLESAWYENHRGLFSNKNFSKILLCDDRAEYDGIDSFKAILESSDNEPPVVNQVSDDLAYILHSSGSTGVPKGIMLTHRNARTFVDWMQKEFALSQDDVVMSRAPFKFDLSVFDIFNTFNAGARLVCFDWLKDRDQETKHEEYVDLMVREKATFLYTTPSTFISLVNKGGLAANRSSLRTVMYAGEPFPSAQLRKLMGALPGTKVANIYGPTETNIITYWWVDALPEQDQDIPLGYVVDDTEILIVAEDQTRICGPNELGEIWCRGGTVTLGYLGMDEKTKESYVRSPFHRYPVFYWRTGDFGTRDESGILHYRGRKDHMVKVKGFRIELGEIENALAQHSDLDELVVVAVPDERYGNRLHCYYSVLKNSKVTSSELIDFLTTKIPEYMIPYRFTELETLPKTSSGKIDRVAALDQAKAEVRI